MAKTRRPLTLDAPICFKLRSADRANLENLDPTRRLSDLLREAIALYVNIKTAQNVNSPAS